MFDILFEIKEDEDLEGDEEDKEDMIEYEHSEDDNYSLNVESNYECNGGALFDFFPHLYLS